jgi:hypothetical protein
MEFALYPLTTVYGGNLFYSLERAAEVLELYNRWIDTLPDEMTSAVAFMNFPPLPAVPEPLRGRSFISVRGCYCLVELKDRYDPNNLFRFNRNIPPSSVRK